MNCTNWRLRDRGLALLEKLPCCRECGCWRERHPELLLLLWLLLWWLPLLLHMVCDRVGDAVPLSRRATAGAACWTGYGGS